MTEINKQKEETIELKPHIQPSISSKDLSVLAHLSALLGFIFPLLAIGGPLTVYLLSADKPDLQAHAKAALNFNITATIALFVSALLIVVLIGFLLLPIVAIFWLVCVVMAAVKAGEGNVYVYPLTINFLK